MRALSAIAVASIFAAAFVGWPSIDIALKQEAPSVVPAQQRDTPTITDNFRRTLECPRQQRCSQVSSCREAVHLWCVCGYSGADGDNEGIPCESLCGNETPENLSRVSSIKAELGCR